jgi:hypothetical protein
VRVERVCGMGVLLGQLPPAELARLKAELTETLIANFCYPRFYDYRTESLRMRPVDSAKRREVSLYLSSVDFTAWSRVDVMSPEFQTYIERLFIHFVQRNRAFFGNQGRKRMADVRMLITSAALAVAEALRAHLTNPQAKRSTFGSPRPVPSWSRTRLTPFPELSWEQVRQTTLLLQQQLQEIRGESEIYDGRASPGRPATTLPPAMPAAPSPLPSRPASAGEERSPLPQQGRRGFAGPTRALPPSSAPAGRRASGKLTPVGDAAQTPHAPPTEQSPTAAPVPLQPRSAAVTQSGSRTLPATQPEGASLPVNEDVTIFEEMRHQLVLWLRVEAVRLGLDISGQSPSQLIELLRRHDGFEQARLQIVSSLLNLIAQVLKNGKASSMDYKQGLMFYLMHTRQLRP